MGFVHLHVHSPFSFQDGASSIEELVQAAARAQLPALALTDHDSLSGAVRFVQAAAAVGIHPILGAELTVGAVPTGADDGETHHLTVLAETSAGYSNLCRLLTAAHLEQPRGQPLLPPAELVNHSQGLIILSGCRRGEIAQALLRRDEERALAAAAWYRHRLGADRFFLEVQRLMLPGDRLLWDGMAALAQRLNLQRVATNNVHYAAREGFYLHDLLTCVRTGKTLAQAHPQRRLNGENYLKDAETMERLFARAPRLCARTLELAQRCGQVLKLHKRRYPAFDLPAGEPAPAMLRRLAYEGAHRRYGRITPALRRRMEDELQVIHQLKLEDYFLLVWDVCRFARREGIRFAGRGSAADSVITYVLGVTEVDAFNRNLLFERFMSLERAEQPDIDIDFDARHRDRVAEYVYRRYGAERVASVATYQTYRARSAVRDFGKAMGLPAPLLDRLAKSMPYIHADAIEEALERVPELRDAPVDTEACRRLFHFCAQAAGFPRHLGTHLGGLVISRRPLTTISPLQEAAKGVTIVPFDKEDVEALGLLKLDLLSLRALSALEDTVVSVQRQQPGFSAEQLPDDDEATYEMLRQGETIGAFQLESPAQRALHSHLEAENLEDIIASVALIRPGPIKGNMVGPYVRRRQGKEPVEYLHPQLKPILEKTYGVVLFQEQVIEIGRTVAGFTPGEADRLRRAMTHARSQQAMAAIQELFCRRAQDRGVPAQTAQEIFQMIAGYASYGFCEAHAAAFGTIAYKTMYLLRHHPAEFFASLLSHQPMGYYPPNSLCVEARRRGVTVLGVDLNRSRWQTEAVSTPAGSGPALRLGLQHVRGLGEAAAQTLMEGAPYRSLAQLCRHSGLSQDLMAALIRCGACADLDHNRRRLLWRLPGIKHRVDAGRRRDDERKAVLPGMDRTGAEGGDEAPDLAEVEDFSPWRCVLEELDVLGIAVTAHPLSFFRKALHAAGFASSRSLKEREDRSRAQVAGLVVMPSRPPTRSGRTIVFFSLEDEFGLTEVTMFEEVYQRYGRLIFNPMPGLLVVEGRVEHQGNGVSLQARTVERLNPEALAAHR